MEAWTPTWHACVNTSVIYVPAGRRGLEAVQDDRLPGLHLHALDGVDEDADVPLAIEQLCGVVVWCGVVWRVSHTW